MISEKLWVIMAVMMVVPFLLVMVLPEPYFSFAILGTNLFMIYYLRKYFKNMTKGIFGGKIKYQCLTCQGTKFDSSGTCHRCGGKSKKPI